MKSNQKLVKQYLKHISQKKLMYQSYCRRIIDDTARLLTIKPLHDLPEHLCFDEFKSVNLPIVI